VPSALWLLSQETGGFTISSGFILRLPPLARVFYSKEQMWLDQMAR